MIERESQSSMKFRHWLGAAAGVGLFVAPYALPWALSLLGPADLVERFFGERVIQAILVVMQVAGIVFVATAAFVEYRRVTSAPDSLSSLPVPNERHADHEAGE